MKETYSRSKSVWQRMNARERKAAMAYGEKYKAFLDTCLLYTSPSPRD